MRNRKSIQAKLRQIVSTKSNPQKSASAQPMQLEIETLEERMMLNGTGETLVFSAGFEDVASGEFTAVAETSEFTAAGNPVEVQDNVGRIGDASEDLILQFESTGISASANAIAIDGGTGDDTIVGSDLVPVLEIQGENFVQQDSEYVLSLPTTNQGEPITRWIVDWGDGTEPESIAGNPDAATHTYSEIGNYTVSAQAFDVNSLQNVAGSTLQVKARGSEGGETFQVLVDDNIVGSFTTSAADQIFTVESDQPLTPDQIKIRFTNDLYDPDNGIDRNLIVDYIDIDGAKYQTEAPNVFSTGTWKPEDGIQPGFRNSQVLHGNGIFQFDAIEGSTVEVIARGSEGTEQFNLLVDGVVVETFAVTQEFESYTWSSPQDVSAKQIRVEFVNDVYDPANGIDSNLHVDRIQIDGVRFETESDDVFSTGTWKPEDGIQPGFRNSQTLHSNGYFQFDSTRANGELVPYLSNLLNVVVQAQPSVLLPNIDFEFSGSQLPLSSGDVIAEQFAELGVHVSTLDSNRPAIIFDSSRPTGGDSDLGTPNRAFGGPGTGAGGSGGAGINDQALRNILIISEDGDSTDPDDNANGGTLVFDFDDPVMLDEIGLLDIENDETEIRVYDIDGNVIDQIVVNGLGDNSFQLVSIDAIGVTRLEIELAASGAVTELVFSRDGQPISPLPPAAFYTVDELSDQGFHYNDTGEQISDFDLVDSQRARGATTTGDGNPVWVLKSNENVYVYDRVNNSFLGEWDAVGPEFGRGIGTDGTDIWIVDAFSDQVFFYEDGAQHTSGSHAASSSFELQSSNYDPSGLVVHDDTIWVTDATADRVFVYDRAGNALGDWSLDSRNSNSSGITTNAEGTHLWVTDFDDGAIYFYEDAASVTSGSLTATSTIDLGSGNSQPGGIAGTPPSPLVDNAPTIAPIATQTVDEGESLSVTATATDADLPNDQLTFSILSGPDGLTIDSDTGEIVFTPTEAQGPDVYSVTVGVSDSDGNTDETAFNINVDEVNLPPVLAPIADQAITAGESVAFTATATDPDLPANTLTFSLGANAPADATIDAATGEFSFTSSETDADAVLEVDVIVTDEGGLTDSQTVAIVVTAIVINGPAIDPIATQTVDEGELLSVTATATDADLPNDQLTFSILSGPDGVTIDSATGEIVWTPTEAQGPGVFSVIVGVSDSEGNTDETSFDINVDEVNLPPVLAPIADQAITAGESVAFTATATDPDLPANSLTFSLGANAPVGASIDASTGEFLFTTGEADADATLEVNVIVTDEGGLTDSQTVAIVVTAIVINGPAIDPIATQTVDEGEQLSVTATATDADLPDDQLTFSILSGPDGLTIDSATGEIVWTPTEAQGPGIFSVTVGVSDSDGNASDTTFNINVGEVNAPPVLAPIADQAINAGESVSFTATATDPDLPANTLTFSLGANAPAGATIDASTGEFLLTTNTADPDATFAFDVIVTDDGGLSDSQTVTIVVARIPVAINVTAGLTRDTARGGVNDDLITSDPSIEGALTTDASAPVNTLVAGLSAGTLVDVSSAINSDGSFALTEAQLEQINGGPLADGQITIFLQATDDQGNSSSITEFTFELDKTAPVLAADLTTATDTGVTGDRTTETAIVDVDLVTEASAALFAGGTIALEANSDGEAVIEGVALDLGDNLANYAAVDIAGNTTVIAETFTRVEPDNQPNRPPEFVSEPDTLFQIPGESNAPVGDVSPELIDLNLADLPQIQNISIRIPTEEVSTAFADIIFVVDESGSLAGEQAFIGPVVEQINAELEARGIGPNRFALVGFTADARIFDGNAGTNVQLFNALGEEIDDYDLGPINDLREIALTANQEFLLIVDNDSADDIGGTNFEVFLAETQQQDLAAGINGGSIDQPGQRQQFDFTVDAFDTYLFDSLTNDSQVRWSLEGPTGAVISNILFNGSDSNARFPVYNLAPGEYRLIVDGIGDFTGDFEFKFDPISTATEVTLGTPVTGEFTNPVETQSYKFDVTAGEKFFFDVIETSDPRAVFVRVIDPFGSQVVTTSQVADLDTITAEFTGTYTLLLEPQITNLGIDTFQFNLVPVVDTAQQLVLEQSTTGAIEIGQTDVYSFDVAEDGNFYFDAESTNRDIRWTLTGPTGTVVSNRSFTSSDSLTGNGVLRLVAGSYTLAVDAVGQNVGEYGFRLLDLANATEVSLDTPISGEFVGINQTDAYQFNATAGDEIILRFPEASDPRTAGFRLIASDGRLVTSGRRLEDSPPILIDNTETFTLVLEPLTSNQVDVIDTYTFNLELVGNTPVAPLAGDTVVFGTDVSGEISADGQIDAYNFTLTEQTFVYVDALVNTSLRWTLTGPGGTLVNLRRLDQTDAAGGVLIQDLTAGDYQLLVSGSANQTGAYGFQLVDLASATPITPGTPVAGEFTDPTRTDFYQFDAVAGDQFYFDVVTTSDDGDGIFRVIDVHGDELFRSNRLRDVEPVEFDVSGTYTLLVEGLLSNTTPDTYELNIVPVTQTTTALTLGSVISDTIDGPGDTRAYTFDVAEYGLYYFDSLSDLRNIRVRLASQSATLFSNRPLDDADSFDQTPILFLAPGSYELGIDGLTDETGEFSFSLGEFSAASVIVPGTPTEVELTTPNETRAFQFDASAGDQVYLDVVTPPTGPGNFFYSLYDQSGNRVSFARGTVDTDVLTLETDGTYTLLVEGRVDSTVADSFTINVVPVAPTVSTPVVLGDLTSGSIASPGQTVQYTLDVGQRTTLYLDSLTNRADITWQIDSPDGEIINARSFANNVQVLTLPFGGEYVLTIDGVNDATGDFAFRLSDTSAAPAISTGTLITNTFTDPLQTDIYQIEGVAGERLFVDVTFAENNNSASYQLLSPAGDRVAFGNRLVDAESEALPIDGTYLLVVEGSSANTQLTSYQLNITSTTSSALPLTVGQTVTGSLTGPGQQQEYVFEVDTYRTFYFDNLSLDDDLRWGLVGPSGSFAGGARLTTASVVNLPPGQYVLTIDGVGQAFGDYAFNLLPLDSATPLTPGTPLPSALTESLESVAFQFDAAVGEKYAVNVTTAINSNDANFVLVDPAGTVILRQRLSSFETTDLLRDGTYTLLVEGFRENDLANTFELELVRIDTPAIPLQLGEIVSRPATHLGANQEFSFDVSAYGDYWFNAVSVEESATWALEGPDGFVTSNQRFEVRDNLRINTFLSDLAPGSYTLTVNSAADYSFQLFDLNTATEIDFGAPVSGELVQSNQADLYRFNATAGDEIIIDFTDASDTAAPDFRLHDPLGREVLFGQNLVPSAPLQLGLAGVYTLVVDGGISDADIVTYSFAVELQGNTPVEPVAGTAIALSTDISGAIDIANETDVYLFEITEHTLVGFDSLTNNRDFFWDIFGPTGRLIGNRLTSDANVTVLDLRPGSYRLEVRGTSGTTGDYTVRLNDLADGTVVTPNTAFSGTLDVPNQTDIYRFDANAGDNFYIDVVSFSDSRAASYRVVDQLGQTVASSSQLVDRNTFEAPLTGTYTLLVEGAIANTGQDTYEIAILTVPSIAESTTELQLGQITSDTIGVQGETKIYTFDVPEYGGYFFDSLTNERQLLLTIHDQAGVRLLNRTVGTVDSVDGTALLNLAPGRYTITVDGNLNNVGDFSFRFSSVADATAIEPGTVTDVVIEGGNTTQAFAFDANEGDTFYFDVVEPDNASNIWFSLFDPDGDFVLRSNRLQDIATDPLTHTGSYTLLVEGRVTNTETESLQLNIVPTGNPVSTVALGDRVSTPLTAGSSATFDLALASGERFVVDSLTTENLGVNILIFDPVGEQLYRGNANLDPPPLRASLTGTYQIVLENAVDTDATIDFRLLSVDDVVVESGDIISAVFDEQNATSVHRLISTSDEIVLRPIRDKQFTTASNFNRISQFLSTSQGGFEDGYLGIQEAIDNLEFRENGANNVILVTDEDRDIARPDVTFESLVQSFVEEDITLNVIVNGNFDDVNGNRALGIINNSNTFVADGEGGFIEEADGVLRSAAGREEYVDLAFAVNGAAWDLNQLRDGGTNAESFTQAFIEVSTRAIAERFGIDVIPSNPNIDIENLTGVVENVQPGDEVEFQIRFNAENAETFDLILVRAGTGVVVGQLPVRIASTYSYEALAIDPDNDVVTYSLQSGPEGATIDSDTGLIDFRPTETGIFDFEILAEDGNGGSDLQVFSVDVATGRVNRQPVITSSPTRFVEFGNDYQYAVVAADSDNDPLQYFLTDSPDGLTIDRTTGLITWAADEVITGSHNVAVRVIDGFGGEATQVYELTVNTPPRFVSPPRTGATPNLPYAYQSVVEDLDGDVLQYSVVSGPDGLTIDQSGLVTWAPGTADFGPVDVEILVTDRFGATASQQYTINVQVDETLPTVTLLPDATSVDVGGVVNFQVDVADDTGIASVTLTVDGQEVPLDINSSGSFTFGISGVFSAVATATDTSGNVAQDIVQIGVLDPSDTEGPTVNIISPLPATEVSYLTNIIGTVNDENLISYRLEYARADLVDVRLIAAEDPDFQLIAEGFENVDGDVVGVFDPTLLANDAYIIRLIATDVNGLTTATAIPISVVGAAKLGTLDLGFTDLVTELDGIRFQFDRNYSSLESGNSGEFGFGWNLSLFNSNIRESVPDAPPQFLGAGESSLRLDTRVYVTAPDGQRLGFTFAPELAAVGLLGATYVPAFEGDPGVRWQLEVPETSTNANILQITPTGEARLNFVGSVYNPETYILVSPEGTRYTYQQHGSLVSVEDTNGNIVNFDGDELVGSDGRSIQIIRDSEDRIVEIIDPEGVSLTYQYNSDGDLIRFVNGEGQATTFEYLADPEHFLDAIYDDAGVRIFKSEFDEAGRLISATDALGNTTSQTFDPGNFTGTRTDAAGNVTLLTYDSLGNVIVEENPQGDQIQFFYDDPNDPSLVTREIDRRGFIQDSTFDENGNLLELSEVGTLANPFDVPLTKSFTYTDANRLASVTNELGATTEFAYDDAGNLISITNALGDSSTFTYDDQGRQIATTDFNGSETTLTYADGNDQPVRVTFGDGTYQEFEYNSTGQTTLERFVEADGTVVREVRSTYDQDFRTTSVAGAEEALTTFIYDGELLQYEVTRNFVVDADTNNVSVRAYEYNDERRVVRQVTSAFDYDRTADFQTQIDAALLTPESVVEQRYDVLGNRILLQDPTGNITTWIYNDLQRVVEERDALFNEGLTIEEALAARLVASGADTTTNTGADHVRAFEYDAHGNLVESIDQNGRRIEFSIDVLGRVTEERWFAADGTQVDTQRFTYDLLGNLLTATDSDSSLTYTYDVLNQLTSVSNAGTTGAPTVVLNYTYDGEGNAISVVDDFGVTVESVYDVRNQLQTRLWFDVDGNDVDDARIDYRYNALGQTQELTRSSSLDASTVIGTTTRTYTLDGYADTILHADGAGDLIASYDYDYNLGGFTTRETRENRLTQFSQTIDYTFDPLGQLSGADYSVSTDELYAYDANGNRVESHLHGNVYRTGAGNRLATDGTYDYTHDGVGNIVSKTRLVSDADGEAGEVTTYRYDQRNRLTGSTLTAADGTTVLFEISYAYDAFGKRISRTENGATVYFVYNGVHVWADFNDSGEVTARYLHGDNTDEAIARFRTNGEGTAWYLGDALGTIRDLAGADGSQVNHTEYESFGRIVSQLNEALADRYSFTGREFDDTLGLYYYRSRLYDPLAGQFNSNDQLGFSAGDTNLSRYVFNSPLQFSDPTGNVAVVSYSALLDIPFSDENLAFTGGVAGFTYSTFSYLGYFLQTGTQSAALDRLTNDLATLLVFDWAVKTTSLAGDVLSIPTGPLEKINTYINGVDVPPETLRDLLRSEAEAQLDAFIAVDDFYDNIGDLAEQFIDGPPKFDPQAGDIRGGGFINGARLFISILRT